MYRTLCVLALLTLQAGLAHRFSWDIAGAMENELEFYNEGKVTYSVTFTDVRVDWITYDPFHNRVLFMNYTRSLFSFDIATGKSQTLIDLYPAYYTCYTYDPATGLFFTVNGHTHKVYSYLVKPGSDHEVYGNFVIDLGHWVYGIAVDSCGGYIYWISEGNRIERVRLNGTNREEVIGSSDNLRYRITIDPQTQNMYWTESDNNEIFHQSADLNGKHRRTLYHRKGLGITVSKDFIYSCDTNIFWKYPKNLSPGTDVEPKQFTFRSNTTFHRYITANYAYEEQPQGIPLCKPLKRLLSNYSETNNSDSFNVSTGGSLLRVNETKVSGESRVSGDTWNVSVCHNYCLQGNCSVSADGQPICRCNVGYAGERCEVNACRNYCLHGGVCSLSEQNNPVCQCTAGYHGERCDVPDFLIRCSGSCSTVSLLKDILNEDLSTEDKGVKSTCPSTVA